MIHVWKLWIICHSVVFELWNSVTFVEGWIWREKQTQKGEELRHLKGVWFTWIGALKLFDAGDQFSTGYEFWSRPGNEVTFLRSIWMSLVRVFIWHWVWQSSKSSRCFFRSGRLGLSCGRPRFLRPSFLKLASFGSWNYASTCQFWLGYFYVFLKKILEILLPLEKSLKIILTLWPSIFSSQMYVAMNPPEDFLSSLAKDQLSQLWEHWHVGKPTIGLEPCDTRTMPLCMSPDESWLLDLGRCKKFLFQYHSTLGACDL